MGYGWGVVKPQNNKLKEIYVIITMAIGKAMQFLATEAGKVNPDKRQDKKDL